MLKREIASVSVVIPVYNGVKYLNRAIQSALEQGELIKEIIVVDDASTDNIETIMQLYEGNPNVFCIKNQKNSGVAFSRNKGVGIATGDYIAFLDADDWWAPKKIEKQISLMSKEESVLSYTGRTIYAEGKIKQIYAVPSKLTYKDVLKCNHIACSSVVIKRDVALEFPMVNENDIHEDYLTWLNVLKKYKTICGIPDSLMNYTYHRDSKSGMKLRSFRMRLHTYRKAALPIRKAVLLSCGYYFHWISRLQFRKEITQ